MVGHRRMDRKLKSLLKGAGLDHLVGGMTTEEINADAKRQREEMEAMTPEQRAAQVKKNDAQRMEAQKQRTKAAADAKAASDKAAADKAAADKAVADKAAAEAAAKARSDAQLKEEYGELKAYAYTIKDGLGSKGYVYGPPAYPQATVADFDFYMEHGNPATVEFENQEFSNERDLIVARHQNETPEQFEETKKKRLAYLKSPYLSGNEPKNGITRLRDLWAAYKLQQLPFWKSAEKYVAKDTVYRQPLKSQGEWAADVQRNVQNWQTRVNDAQLPEAKASLISEFGEYQRLNASYDAYVANENAKPAPPSFEGKDITEVTKGVAEEDVRFDKNEKLRQLRDADDMTSHDVAEKIATLNGMKTGIPTADQEIDEALAYIKWGEELREQVALWETAGAKKDMTLQEYWSSIGEPDLIDVEAEVAKEKQQIQNRIDEYKRSPKYVFDQIKKWGLLVIDIGVNFLPYVLPFPIGNVIQLGYQAFAPVGSIYHTEGSFTQKLQAGLVNGAEQAVLGMIGLGRKGRRKYMKTLMESEEGGEMGQIRQIEDDSSSHHALHDKTPARSQRRRRVRHQT